MPVGELAQNLEEKPDFADKCHGHSYVSQNSVHHGKLNSGL